MRGFRVSVNVGIIHTSIDHGKDLDSFMLSSVVLLSCLQCVLEAVYAQRSTGNVYVLFGLKRNIRIVV